MSGNPKNFAVNIKSHEKTQAQLDVSIAFVRWKAGQRIESVQEQAIATDTTFTLAELLALDHKHCCDNRHEASDIALGTANTWRLRLPRWQLPRARGDVSAVRPGPAGSTSNPGSNSEVSERDYPKRKVFIPNQS